MVNVKYYFDLWRTKVSIRKYDEWCEINNERLQEEQYAQQTGMDSVDWCWNCKYSDCNLH